MRRILVVIASLVAAHAGADVYDQTFGSSKYENKTIYLQSGGNVTHTFRINGVFGNSVNSFRTDWYSTEDIQGSSGFIESDSSNLGNGYWDPEVTRTYTSAGTYFARGEVMTRDYAWQDFWWKETHQWRLTVIIDTTGPSWSSGSVDLNNADDTGRYNNDDVTRNTSGLTFSWPSATDSQIGLDRYEWRLGTSGAWNNRNLNTSVDISASQGNQTFYVRAVDKAGNPSSTKSLNFTVDTTSPNVPSIVYPSVNQRITDTTPPFDWTGSDNSGGSGIWKYHLLVETDTLGVNKIDEYPTSSSYDTPGSQALDAGGSGYDWELWAYDTAGNQSSGTGEKRFYVDDPPDTERPSAPGTPDLRTSSDTGASDADNITRVSTPTFDWSAATDNKGVAGYEYRTDGGSWVDRGNNLNVTLSTQSDGQHTLEVRAYDAAGNRSLTPSSLAYTVDTTSPNVPSIVYPSVNQRITDTTPAFDWSGSDNSGGSGIWKYHLLVETDTLGVNKIDEYPTSSSYDTPAYQALDADGAGYDWELWAYDIAGNQSSGTGEKRFYVDDIPYSAAEITEFNVTSGTITFGSVGQATVTFKNTGNFATNFWVGLSFEAPNAEAWPGNGWLDVPPVQVGTPSQGLAPGGSSTVTFQYYLPDWLTNGQYRAYAAVWERFDAHETDYNGHTVAGLMGGTKYAETNRLAFTLEETSEADPYALNVLEPTGGLLSSIPSRHKRASLNELPQRRNPAFRLSDANGDPIGSTASNVVVLVHGWRHTGGYEGDDEFGALRSNLLQPGKLPGNWRLVPYDWGHDADTGFIIPSRDAASASALSENGMLRTQEVRLSADGTEIETMDVTTVILAVTYISVEAAKQAVAANSTVAAYRGYMHGLALGERLLANVGVGNLRKVHLVAHSAGSWGAYAAVRYLRQNAPDLQIQVTFLDPFIPARIVSDLGNFAGFIGIREGAVAFQDSRLQSLIDYAQTSTPAVHKTDCYWTQNDEIFWGAKIVDYVQGVIGQRFGPVVDTLQSMITPKLSEATIVTWSWGGGGHIRNTEPYNLGHNGPILFYAESVADPYNARYAGGGWAYSMEHYDAVQSVISVTPTSRDFGSIEVGTSMDRSFTVENVGGGTLSGSASVSAPYSIVSGGTYSLGAGASQTVTVRYNPTAAGTHNSDVTFTGGDGISRSVSGSAYNPGELSVAPSGHDFGSVEVGTTVDRTFTVHNTGGSVVSGSASVASPFFIVTGSPYSLVGGASQAVTVRYSPTEEGTHNQDVTFTGGGGALRSVTGRAFVVNALTITPESRNHTHDAQSGQTIGVTANVSWTASRGSDSWITITDGSSGSGNGTVTYGVAANDGPQRSGAIDVSGGGITREFTVHQDAGELQPVETPTFSPDGGSFSSSSVTVTVTCATAEATIRYTTDASDPTESSPVVASGGSVDVPVPGILKAKGWKAGLAPSETKTATYDQGTVPDGLVALYPFEDGTADNAITGAGALPDLVSSGCAVTAGDAVVDSGLDYLELPVPLGASPFTIWIDATYEQSAGHASIVSQGLPTPDNRENWDFGVWQFVIAGVSPNWVRTVYYGAWAQFNSIDTGIGLMDGSRRRIALTWDGSEMGAFFDGSLQTRSATGWPDIDGTAVRFGASEFGGSASKGRIHEIRIYDRALSEAELSELGSSGQPDLIVQDLEVIDHATYDIAYRYTIKNVGDRPANLDGPSGVNSDNVSVQAFVSTDTVFNNGNDLAAGGTIVGVSPLGNLGPGETLTGTFGCSVSFDPQVHRYLVLKVDWGAVVNESDEENNTLAIAITNDTPNGLVGLYPFEDGTADNMITGAGALPDLVSSGCEVAGGDAVVVSGLDYLELPVTLGVSAFTIWIDATYEQSAGHASIVSQGLPTPDNRENWDFSVSQFVIAGVSPNRARTVFYGASSEFNSIDTGIGLMDGSRRRMAITWDGSEMGAFFDGSLQTGPATGWPDIDGTAVRFGASEFGGSASRGQIHEIRVYDRALSEAELAALGGGEEGEVLIRSNFDEDVADQQPATGGANQPTSLTIPSAGSILVRTSANGIDSQPVELYDGGSTDYVSVNYSFGPVTSGMLRVEATVSFDTLVSGYFLQTAVPSAVATRLGMASDGRITDYGSSTLGQYAANTPFRVRMDIDLDTKTWAAAVDDEMDGFANDPVTEDLEFLNDAAVITQIGQLLASLNTFGGQGETRVAYDDIYVKHIAAHTNRPDLVVSALEVTSWTSNSIQYAGTIKNVGAAPADLDGPTGADSDNVSIQAFFSADTVFNNAGDIPAGGTILGSSPLGTLQPGETRTFSFGASAGVNPSTHPYLVLKVDWGEVVAESDELNNALAVAIPPASRPDLIVQDLEVIDHATYDIAYRYTIKNVGDGPANLDGPTGVNSDNVSVQAFVSTDTVFNNGNDLAAGGTIVGVSPLGNLEPGETLTGTFGCSVSFDPQLHRYLVLKVDWGEVVDESDEENNTLAVTITNDAPIGLVGHYPFEDGTADNAITGAGALPDLVSSGCAVTAGDAVLDSGLDYLELPVPLGTSAFTIWIDATYEQSAGHASIVSQGLPTPDNRENWDFLVSQFVIAGVSPNRARTIFYGANSEFNSIDTGIGLMDGARRRIALTWDGSVMGAFFDGSLQTGSATGWPDIDGTAVRFGACEFGGLASRGHIHEIRVYDRALSEGELAELGSSGQPDLIVQELEVIDHATYDIAYRYTIKNVGDGPANLDGPTGVNSDNVSVQAFVSTDTVFNNGNDLAAGGTIVGLSPLGALAPGETLTGTFGATVSFDPQVHKHLVLKVDWGGVVEECDESNNTASCPVDDDGTPNDWEYFYFGTAARDCSVTDGDLDGFLDQHEYIAGTLPMDQGDFFRIEFATADSGQQPAALGGYMAMDTTGSSDMTIHWRSVSNRIYTVYCCTNLHTAAWTNVHETAGDGSMQSYTGDDAEGHVRFYRLGVRLSDE